MKTYRKKWTTVGEIHASFPADLTKHMTFAVEVICGAKNFTIRVNGKVRRF